MSDKSGNYVRICLSNLDDEPIYKHETDEFYLSHVTQIVANVDLNFWAISERITGNLETEFLGVNSGSGFLNCPDSLNTPLWFSVDNLEQAINLTVTTTI